MSESKVQGRRNTVLATVIGSVLATYAGSASALEFEFENGAKLNWNTTISVGASWRAQDPDRLLYTKGDGSLIGLTSGPLPPGVAVGPKDGLAGNQAGGVGNLNYEKGDRFSTPAKLITDVELKKGRFGGLLRVKAWYDQALNQEEVLIGNQANNFNGTRPQLGPYPPFCFMIPQVGAGTLQCIPTDYPFTGSNIWPKDKLSDQGFEAEQKFKNVYLLDAYVYGSFALGESDLQLRLGNQVVNWGESLFIQGVNQINPIDVPAARRAGAEVKEILMPVWMAYANWGFNFGSLEAFYQLQWNNTSIDSCDTYWSGTGNLIAVEPNACRSFTTFTPVIGQPVPGTASPLIPQFGSTAFGQATGTYVPQIDGKEPSDSGQFGLAFRFPVDAIDTEIGLYAMNIHSRTPTFAMKVGTTPGDLPAPLLAALQAAGLVNAAGDRFVSGTSSFPTTNPALAGGAAALSGGQIVLNPFTAYFEYPEDIQVYGISATTNLFGWAVQGEISYQTDVPVGVNGNDAIGSMVAGIGPFAERTLAVVAAEGEGGVVQAFDRFDKTQYQVSGIKTFSNILGAQNMAIAAEVAMQTNNVPDYTKGAVRYGRNSIYGTASSPALAAQNAITGGNTCSPTLVGLPVPVASPLYNPSPLGCKNDGFVTDLSWGYRVRVSMDYNNVMNTGVTMTPSVFWLHDVDGVSMDSTFNEDRKNLGLGLKFVYNKNYTLDLNYVDYSDDNFDPTFDRDYYSFAVSVTF